MINLLQSSMFLAQQNGGELEAAGGVMAIGFFCCWIIFVLALFGFWLWMLIDCARRDFPGNEKLIWILVIVLLQALGALIYLFVGRGKGKLPGE